MQSVVCRGACRSWALCGATLHNAALRISAEWKRRLVQNSEPQQPLCEFLRQHGRTVVAHRGPGQTALLNSLGPAMDEILRCLGQIPLQVRTVPRVIVQDAQSDRVLPQAPRRDHLQRAVMEVEVPQRADVLGLVTADLDRKSVV